MNRSDRRNTDEAAADYQMDEHVDDVTGHVVIDPQDDIGHRVEPAVFRLNRIEAQVLRSDPAAGFRLG